MKTFTLSQTTWFAAHQAKCASVAYHFDATTTHEFELEQQYEEWIAQYDDMEDMEINLVEKEYDALLAIVLCGSAADIDEEGEIYDRDGEEIEFD